MVCPSCRISRLVQIAMELNGRSIVMRSCSECGTRWDQGQQRLELAQLLELVAASR